jgi:hypothetical protein
LVKVKITFNFVVRKNFGKKAIGLHECRKCLQICMVVLKNSLTIDNNAD